MLIPEHRELNLNHKELLLITKEKDLKNHKFKIATINGNQSMQLKEKESLAITKATIEKTMFVNFPDNTQQK